MFFKKKREEKAATAAQARQAILDAIDGRISAAEKIADPAKKFIALEDISTDIGTQVQDTHRANSAATKNKFFLPYLGTAVGTVTAVGLAVVTLHFPPVAMMAMFPGIFSGIYVGAHATTKAEKKLADESEPFFRALEQRRTRATALADKVLESNLSAIAESADFKDVLAKAPRVKDHFAEAFAKKVATEEKPEAIQQKKLGPQGGLQL